MAKCKDENAATKDIEEVKEEINKELDEIRAELRQVRKAKEDNHLEGLSTGSTLLNLACTGRADIGFLNGTYTIICGASSSGKTFLTLTCLAEAGINQKYGDYRFIFDNAENGALMDVREFFGPAVEDKLEPPAGTREEPKYSSTVEEFYYHLDDAFEHERPFIYILDSMDALTTEDESDKFDERKKAAQKGKDVSGSYGTAKAKLNSSNLRVAVDRLRKSKSILLIVSQIRDNIGFGSQYNPQTRSGGHALRFYATCELWSTVKGKIVRTVKGKPRQLGVTAQIKVKKNRVTGQEHCVEIPIYHQKGVGIDDIGSMVDYLVDEGKWKETKGNITAPELDLSGHRETLIAKIVRANKQQSLKDLTISTWKEIEEACIVERGNKYS